MKRFLAILLCVVVFCCLLCGCNSTVQQPAQPPEQQNLDEGQTQLPSYEEGSYVLLIYMCGSSLESQNGAASRNLSEMLAAEIPEKTQIIVQTGGARVWRGLNIPSDKSCRYELKDGQLVSIEENSSVNMGLSSSLSDFITWGVAEYPAEEYGLILWNHGGGSLGGVCFDENFHNDSLTLSELDTAFETATSEKEITFDFIGFDACLMATIETAFIVEKYADNMIASQELEPAGGWDYSALVENLGQEDFYGEVLDGYAQKSASKNYYTLSHIDFSQFSTVAEMFSRLVSALQAETTPRNTISALRNSINFGMTGSKNYGMFDLGNMFALFNIEGDMSLCVETVNGELRDGASGISIYFPLDAYSNLATYSSVSPLESYVGFLEDFFAERDKETISFLSYAEKANNKLSFTLTDSSLDYVQDVTYSLYHIENDGERERIFGLGSDSNTNIANTRVTVDFEGRWIELDGKSLYCEILDESRSIILFSAPVTVDFYFADLIFAYDKETLEAEIIGVVYEGEEGRVYDLEEEQIIRVTRHEVTDGNVSEWDYSDGVIYSNDTRLDIGVLDDSYYQYTAYVTDVYGKRYTAGTAVISILEGQVTIIAVTADEPDYIS